MILKNHKTSDNTQWYKIFDTEQDAYASVPVNSFYTLRFGFTKVCIIHLKKGLFAIEDACPHKLIPLSKGCINEQDQIVCMSHQYTFDLKTGEEMTGKNIRNVKTFPLEVRDDGIYLGLPVKTSPKDDFSY